MTTTTTALTKQKEIKALMQSPAVQEAIMRAKPAHISAQKIVSAALMCVSENPALAKNPNALLKVTVQAAQLGLELGATLGEAYPVPFGQDITLIVGYKGLCKLARNSGEIASIEARAVFQGDEIAVEYGTESGIKHTPKIDGPAGDLIGAYSVIHLKAEGTRPLIDYMPKDQIEKVKARSRSGSRGPWVDDLPEMAKKTVTKRNLKYAPRSAEMAWAMRLDDASDSGLSVVIGKEDIIDLSDGEDLSQADALEAQIVEGGE